MAKIDTHIKHYQMKLYLMVEPGNIACQQLVAYGRGAQNLVPPTPWTPPTGQMDVHLRDSKIEQLTLRTWRIDYTNNIGKRTVRSGHKCCEWRN